MSILKTIKAIEVKAHLEEPVDAETLRATNEIVENVKNGGEDSLRSYAERFSELAPGESLFYTRDELKEAFHGLPENDQELLKRTAERISVFAEAQRNALKEVTIDIPGGQAGHYVDPVETAGCYAPGGGFPLPSSVMMTAITARVAGVENVIVASPKPTEITMAAAYISDADLLLKVGGAHAVAAMAYGVGGCKACDVIVGPGSKWVTAAKKVVFGRVAIDMLAGPSELVVLADDSADPAVVAADLIAQAEHGFDSLPILVTTSSELIDRTNDELSKQLQDLPTAETAKSSLEKGYAVLCENLESAIIATDQIAPEHLEVIMDNSDEVSKRLKHYGGLFIGAGTAEVMGDYGAGPNHTLPTGGTARYTGGLSVFNFLRIRTWMKVDDLSQAKEIAEDARDLARHEKLEGHARSAEKRLVKD